MAHEVEGAVDASIAGADDLLLGQVSEGIASGMRMTEKQELDSLLAVIEDELIIENEAGDFELAVGHILAAGGRFASLGKFLGTVDAQQSSAVCLSDDAGPCLTKRFVAVGVVTVMMRVEHIANRLVGGFF